MDEDLAAQNRRIKNSIREYGWHCIHVFPTEEDQEKFTYSIGFAESYSAPEVLIFGLELEEAYGLLSECAILLQDGHTILLDAEDANVLAGDYKVIFKSVRPDSFGGYLGTALQYYTSTPFSAVVMFLPDRLHRFPWESGYDYISAEEALAIV